MTATPRWAPLFFAVGACSWVPHWSCHYYRLETGSSFTVGSWQYTPRESVVAMAVYALLIAANLAATVAPRSRVPVAFLSGLLHLGFAGLHSYRLFRPFRFEVFGYPWSLSASTREALILAVFGVLSLVVAQRLRHERPAG